MGAAIDIEQVVHWISVLFDLAFQVFDDEDAFAVYLRPKFRFIDLLPYLRILINSEDVEGLRAHLKEPIQPC